MQEISIVSESKMPFYLSRELTVERAHHSYVLLGLFCASEAICANRLLQQPFVKLSGGPLLDGIQTCAVMHIYTSHTHAEFAE